MPEEHSPCANIIIIAPLIPHEYNDNTPIIIKAICTTEEYAIITFISLIIRQTIPRTPPPNKEILIIDLKSKEELNNDPKRIIPYPPNFNKIPARIIDPPTGASTWALGSHWWTKNIGNLTKKAKTAKKVKEGIVYIILDETLKKNIDLEKFFISVIIIISNKGKEANKV